MIDRAEIMTRIACACIRAGHDLPATLRFSREIADAILAPTPTIDHKLARDLDRALNGKLQFTRGSADGPDLRPADKAGAAVTAPPPVRPAAPADLNTESGRGAAKASRSSPAAEALASPTATTDKRAKEDAHVSVDPMPTAGAGGGGRAVQPRTSTPTGNAPAASANSDDLAAQLRRCAADGLTSRQAADRLGIKPDYCRAFASKQKISFGHGKTGPRKFSAQEQAAIEAQRRAKQPPETSGDGKRVCWSCDGEFVPKAPHDTCCPKCVEKILGPARPPDDLTRRGGGKWS